MKAWTITAGMVLFLSVLAVDSDTLLPLLLCCVCWAYLMAAAHRNGWLYDPEKEDDFE